ncbi:hypothetical protein BREVNS_1366 [Brevinematales bacterium NS]|nr:hypothetical protein BREVNS_1366 [Brevinematales bacterium NS]
MEGEFRLFLVLLALVGWGVHEGIVILAKVLATPIGRLSALGVAGVGGWFLGGWPAGLVGCGVAALLAYSPPKWRIGIGFGLSLLLMVWYAFTEERVWFFLRPWLWSLAEKASLSPEVVNIVVFFRPWYAGYLVAHMLWGVYRVYGKYPFTLWYRLVRRPLLREVMVFGGLSGLMLIGTRERLWIGRLLAGPWMVLLSFFVWRGVMVVHTHIGRRLPFWMVVALVMVLLLWLGEEFLVGVWVFAGVGLMSDFFVEKKETR